MKYILSILLSVTISLGCHAQRSSLRTHGTSTQLLVDGEPFLVLGGELGNSSASCAEDIDRIFPKLNRMGLNTVLVPAYWDLTEPMEGEFDFSLTDKVLEAARENDLKVVFLWFGAWKNSMSCYAPEWFKTDYRKYPRARTREGKPLEIASAFSENVFKADNKAFGQWLRHIAEVDKDHGTVIMVQIENEIGMLESARDHSNEADKAFNSPVPERLMKHLGLKGEGTWEEVFGEGLYTDEKFMAWHYGLYVERMAQTARSIYNVPLFVNAAMNSRGRKPGEYPSAGPLAHLKDIWKCAAPSVDFLSPDIYDDGFKGWVAKYDMPDNPLFIPEAKLTENNGVRAFYVFGEHDAIGMCPFSIEDGSDSQSSAFVQGYRKLEEMMPLIIENQGREAMWGLLFDQNDKERIIVDGDLTLTCRHNFTLPWDPRATDGSVWPEGGGIIIRISEYEYIVAGNGIVVEFAKTSEKAAAKVEKSLGEDGFVAAGGRQTNEAVAAKWDSPRCGLASVDEVRVNKDGTLSFVRRLNGDQDHQGRHVRISVGDYKVLKVRLYEYR